MSNAMSVICFIEEKEVAPEICEDVECRESFGAGNSTLDPNNNEDKETTLVTPLVWKMMPLPICQMPML